MMSTPFDSNGTLVVLYLAANEANLLPDGFRKRTHKTRFRKSATRSPVGPKSYITRLAGL